MRLVVWNCAMALHDAAKWSAFTSLQPDVAVVPEAAAPHRPAAATVYNGLRSRAWVGKNANKGLLAASYGDFTLDALPRSDDELPDALATRVTGPGIEFVLAAIWAQKHTYVERLHDVLDAYAPLLRSHETVLAGDFNSNAVFDRKHGDKSHTRLVERLRDFGLVSVYHSLRSEPHGAETENTYFHCRRIGQPYHLDYVFVPREWLPRIRSCSVGDAATWLEHSDHCPVVVDVAAG